MLLNILYWVLIVVALIFGLGGRDRVSEGNYVLGNSILVIALFIIIGLRSFATALN